MPGDLWSGAHSSWTLAAQSLTRYLSVAHSGKPNTGQTTATPTQLPASSNLTLDRLFLKLIGGNRTGMAIWLQVNGADTALTVEALTPFTSGIYEDLTNSVVVTPTDLLNYRLFSGTGGSINMSLAQVGMRVSHATKFYTRPGVGGPWNLTGASVSRYSYLAGPGVADDTQADVQTELPISGTIEQFAAVVSTNPRSSVTKVRVTINGTPSSYSIDFNAAETGLKELLNPGSLTAGDQVAYVVELGTGTGTLVMFGIALLISTTNNGNLFIAADSGPGSVSATRYGMPVADYTPVAAATDNYELRLRISGRLTYAGVRVLATTGVYEARLLNGAGSQVGLNIPISGSGWIETVLGSPISIPASETYQLEMFRTSGAITVAAVVVGTDEPATGVDVTPAAVSVVAATVAPTVQLGSIQVTPAAVAVVAAKVDPTVVLSGGDVPVTPAAVAVVAATVAPTVVLGALQVTPAAVAVVAATVAPGVQLGSVEVTPAAVAVVAASDGPTVVLGSLDVVAAAVAVVGAVQDPTVSITAGEIIPAAVAVGTATAGPTVFFGSVEVAVDAVAVGCLTAGPTVSLGSLLLTVAAVAVGTQVGNPTVSIIETPVGGGQGDSDYEYWRRRRRSRARAGR